MLTLSKTEILYKKDGFICPNDMLPAQEFGLFILKSH